MAGRPAGGVGGLLDDGPADDEAFGGGEHDHRDEGRAASSPHDDDDHDDHDDDHDGGVGPAEQRRRRIRMMSLAAAAVLILGALPAFFGVRAASSDPVLTSLDALAVPAWAATATDDTVSGSRWCLIECRFRERTTQSERPFAETAQAYETALTGAGWQPWKVGECPEQPVDGVYNCWRRDEFTLDLWVRQPSCVLDAAAAQAAAPSTAADGSIATPAESECTGSTVTIKVQNAITDVRGQPKPPEKLGETPDAVPGGDPLPGATPTPS